MLDNSLSILEIVTKGFNYISAPFLEVPIFVIEESGLEISRANQIISSQFNTVLNNYLIFDKVKEYPKESILSKREYLDKAKSLNKLYMEEEEILFISDPYLTGKEKLFIIKDFIINIDKDFSLKELIIYKTLLLTIYHSYTFVKRFHNLHELKFERLLLEQIDSVVRAIIKRHFNIKDEHRFENKVSKVIGEIIVEILKNYKEEELNHTIKVPELDDYEVIFNNIVNIILKKSPIDTICFIPSGGTETACILKCFLEFINKDTNVNLLPLYISRYSRTRLSKTLPAHSDMYKYLKLYKKNVLHNKNILIIDDNANTGLTINVALQQIRKFNPNSVEVDILEMDPCRTIFKFRDFSIKPETLISPKLLSNTLSFVPISLDSEKIKDFKQERKYLRLIKLKNLIVKSYKKISPIQKYKANSKSVKGIKICGVHNIYDYTCLKNVGINTFGVHITYNFEEYIKKLIESDDHLGVVEATINYEYTKNCSNILPLAEFEAIQQMLKNVSTNSEIFFLFKSKSVREISKVYSFLKSICNSDKISIQIQSSYDKDFIERLKNILPNVSLVQMISMEELSETQNKINLVNNDKNIDYILLDTDQSGGTGKYLGIDPILKSVAIITKPFWVAGGISEHNIQNIKKHLESLSIKNFVGFDLESSLEFSEKIIYVDNNGTYIKLRKDPKKIINLINKLNGK